MRSRALLVGMICCFAMPVVLAFLPSTAWFVRNSARVIPYYLEIRRVPDFPGNIDSDLTTAYEWKYPIPADGPGFDLHLAYLLDENGDRAIKVEALRQWVLQNPHSGLLIAAYLGRASAVWRVGERSPGSGDTYVRYLKALVDADELRQKNSRHWDEIVAIAKLGRSAEPENAAFPLYEAIYEFALGQEDQSLRTLHVAACCRSYSDYHAEINALLRQDVVRQWGYRGTEFVEGAGQFFQRTPPKREYAKEINATLNRDAILDLIRCSNLIYENGRDELELLVALSFFSASLPAYPREYDDLAAQRDAIVEEASHVMDPSALGFAAEMGTVNTAANRIEQPKRQDADARRLTGPDMVSGYTYRAADAFMLLLALTTVSALSFILAKLKWSGPPAASLPALVAAIAGYSDWHDCAPASGTSMLLPLAIAYAVLAVGAGFARFRKLSMILGVVVPVAFAFRSMDYDIHMIAGNGGPYEAIPLIFYLLLLGRYWWRVKKGSGATLLVFPTIALLLGCVYIDHQFQPAATLFFCLIGPILLTAGWQSVSLAEASRQLLRVAPFVGICYGLLVSVFILLGVASDNHARAYFDAWRREAPSIRAWAHEHRYKPIPKAFQY